MFSVQLQVCSMRATEKPVQQRSVAEAVRRPDAPATRGQATRARGQSSMMTTGNGWFSFDRDDAVGTTQGITTKPLRERKLCEAIRRPRRSDNGKAE